MGRSVDAQFDFFKYLKIFTHFKNIFSLIKILLKFFENFEHLSSA